MTFMVELSFYKPQGSLVQETSSGVVMFHPDVTNSFLPNYRTSASERLKPFPPPAARVHHRGAGMLPH